MAESFKHMIIKLKIHLDVFYYVLLTLTRMNVKKIKTRLYNTDRIVLAMNADLETSHNDILIYFL